MPSFRDIPIITIAKYKVDVMWSYLENWLESENPDMDPDFQRGYVWTQKQKEQYVEWILRNGDSGRDVYFNHPGWFREWEGRMIIVDGKQRIDAVIGFLNNKVKAYGYYRSQYSDTWNNLHCSFHVHAAPVHLRPDARLCERLIRSPTRLCGSLRRPRHHR